jgi:hypothetical protein
MTTEAFIQDSSLSQELIIAVELVVEEGEHDPALLNALGDETVRALQQEGYVPLPSAYTGQKGIESFFVELGIAAQQLASSLRDNHAAIAEGIADLSGLVTIFTTILPVLKRLQHSHAERMSKAESAAHPIRMTVEIDGASIGIEAEEPAQAEAALQLALKYRAAHPATASQVTTKSKIKVRGQVRARKRRPRR